MSIGIPTTAATTGSYSEPSVGNTFAAAFLDETELYEYLNDATGGPSPNGSPGAYDAATNGLQSLPSGTVVPYSGVTPTGPSLPTTGAGLPYAAIY